MIWIDQIKLFFHFVFCSTFRGALEPCQTSKVEFFTKIFKLFQKIEWIEYSFNPNFYNYCYLKLSFIFIAAITIITYWIIEYC